MHSSHLQKLFALAWLVTASVMITPARAVSSHKLGAKAMDVSKSQVPVLRTAGRKGTRLYRPDDAGVDKEGAEADSEGLFYSQTETLEACMETWDRETHISKSRWREICQREIKARNAEKDM